MEGLLEWLLGHQREIPHFGGSHSGVWIPWRGPLRVSGPPTCVLDGLNRMSANGVHGVMSLCSWVIQCNACHGVGVCTC